MPPKLTVYTGLSVCIAGVKLVVIRDGNTAKIVQEGETMNGSAEAIAVAQKLLAERVRRFFPGLRVNE